MHRIQLCDDALRIIYDFAFTDEELIERGFTQVLKIRLVYVRNGCRHINVKKWWYYAMKHHRLDVLKWITANGIFINWIILVISLANNNYRAPLEWVLNSTYNVGTCNVQCVLLYKALLGAVEGGSLNLMQDLYQRLFALRNITPACKKRLLKLAALSGKLDKFLWLKSLGANSTICTLLYASVGGCIPILEIILVAIRQRRIHDIPYIVNTAIEYGCNSIAVLQLLSTRFKCEPNAALRQAVYMGNKTAYEWLLVKYCSELTEYTQKEGVANSAIRSARVDMIQYVWHICALMPHSFIIHSAIYAIKHCGTDLLKWLVENDILDKSVCVESDSTTECMESVCEESDSATDSQTTVAADFSGDDLDDMHNWNKIADAIVKYNRLDLLKWLFLNIRQNVMSIYYDTYVSATKYGRIHILHKLHESLNSVDQQRFARSAYNDVYVHYRHFGLWFTPQVSKTMRFLRHIRSDM